MNQLPLFANVSLSVTDITRYLRALLESDDVLRDVWVQGEISNLSRPSSGHIYFTLKDETAALRSVIWKTNALRMRLPLQNGTRVEAHGYISLYERDGQYQLYIDGLRLAGEGLLYQEFLRLKARLEAEGLFDPEHKRPIPAHPKRIGIVTSPTGAALQDMLNTLQRRYPLAEVLLAPTAVQGEEAPAQIMAALERLNRLAPDVILLARGGGSLEDLWAFNDEGVVRAVAASPAPVITGIGHETDFTLADFAADLRAPTPTAAAMLAAPDAADLRAALDNLAARLAGAVEWSLQQQRRDLQDRIHRLDRVSPAWRVSNDRQRLDMLSLALQRGAEHTLSLDHAQAQALRQRLAALNPLAVLQRGFAVVSGPDGAVLRSVTAARPGLPIHVRLADGTLQADVTQVHPAEAQNGGQ